jgi:hypothetical protein
LRKIFFFNINQSPSIIQIEFDIDIMSRICFSVKQKTPTQRISAKFFRRILNVSEETAFLIDSLQGGECSPVSWWRLTTRQSSETRMLSGVVGTNGIMPSYLIGILIISVTPKGLKAKA